MRVLCFVLSLAFLPPSLSFSHMRILSHTCAQSKPPPLLPTSLIERRHTRPLERDTTTLSGHFAKHVSLMRMHLDRTLRQRFRGRSGAQKKCLTFSKWNTIYRDYWRSGQKKQRSGSWWRKYLDLKCIWDTCLYISSDLTRDCWWFLAFCHFVFLIGAQF